MNQADDDPADDRSDAADTVEDDPYGARSDAENEYLTTLTDTFETLTESMDRYDAVLDGPTFGDADSINDLIDIISTWDFAHRDAQALTPPPGFEELHVAYLDFTGALHRAARKIAAEDFNSAAVELAGAQDQAEIVVALLEEASRPGFFDIKSGHVQR